MEKTKESDIKITEKGEIIFPEIYNAIVTPGQATCTDNRSFEEIKQGLALKNDDLLNKTILDLGAGTGNFNKAVLEKEFFQNTSTRVISFDFNYFKRINKQLAYMVDKGVSIPSFLLTDSPCPSQSEGIEKTAGLFTQLPFRDNFFDLIISEAAMPLYLYSKEHVIKSFDEVMRVLKPGGEARISPLSHNVIKLENIEDKQKAEKIINDSRELIDTISTEVFIERYFEKEINYVSDKIYFLEYLFAHLSNKAEFMDSNKIPIKNKNDFKGKILILKKKGGKG